MSPRSALPETMVADEDEDNFDGQNNVHVETEILHRQLFAIFVLLVACSACSGADFTDLIVFGDSLSDVGNIDSATLGLQPGGDYYEGRFSNGPVYSERLAERMGFGPLERSSAGGNNFAYGGARTSGTSFFEGGFFIRDLDEQVDNFLNNREVDPGALHLIFAGANDYALGNETNPTIPVGRIATQIGRLADAGARNFLSINLPLLGQTPRFANDRETMNSRSREFNVTLDSALDGILERNSELSILRADLGELFGQLIDMPTAFGFMNVTDEGLEADDATGFVFWDNIHPTTATHALLATATFDLIEPWPIIGDANFNGQLEVSDADILGYSIRTQSSNSRFDLNQDAHVNMFDMQSLLARAKKLNGDADFSGSVGFADFLRLQRNFGRSESVFWSSGDFDSNGTVAFADFVTLAGNFGRSSPNFTMSVPEPSQSVTLVLLAASCLFRRRRISVRRGTFPDQ
jgi:phospholipase/lecithinase/hemolysin